MKCVDEVLRGFGFYSVLFQLIDSYDGDTHLNEDVKKDFTTNVIQPLNEIIRRYHLNAEHIGFGHLRLRPKQLLAIVLATCSSSRHSILFCGKDSYLQFPVRTYINTFYQLKERENHRSYSCRISEERKIIEVCYASLYHLPPELFVNEYQKFVFYGLRYVRFCGFKVFDW